MARPDEERKRELFSERGNKVPREPAAEREQIYEGTEANRDTHAGKNKKTSKNGHQSLVRSQVYDIVHNIIAFKYSLSLSLPPYLLGGTSIWLTVVCTGATTVESVVSKVTLPSLYW